MISGSDSLNLRTRNNLSFAFWKLLTIIGSLYIWSIYNLDVSCKKTGTIVGWLFLFFFDICFDDSSMTYIWLIYKSYITLPQLPLALLFFLDTLTAPIFTGEKSWLVNFFIYTFFTIQLYILLYYPVSLYSFNYCGVNETVFYYAAILTTTMNFLCL